MSELHQPLSAEQAFDDVSPWGRYRPVVWARVLVWLCHAVPARPWLRRIALWMRHPLKHHVTPPVDAEVWGYRLRLMTGDNLVEAWWLYLPQFHDAGERDAIREALPPDGVFLDIGANAGFYSFWAAKSLGPTGRVLAIEPDPEMQRRLRYNLAVNRLDRVTVLPIALGDQAGQQELTIDSVNRGENALASPPPHGDTDRGSARRVTVAVQTLEAVCREQGVERIDALKIDVEGFEDRVLRPFFRDAPRTLWPAVVVIEHKHAEGWEHNVIEQMKALGYREARRCRLNLVLRLDPAAGGAGT